MKNNSFDHIIRGNVFVLKNAKSPMVLLQSADCSGVEIYGNLLAGGSGKFAAGAGIPLRQENNRLADANDIPASQPPVPSIFEWQRRTTAAERR
jgi:hypothetical protein